jgi:hypothetical protein
MLIDRRWHLSLPDVKSFRRADCDTDHYLMIAKFRERPWVNKQEAQEFIMKGFIFKNLNEVHL